MLKKKFQLRTMMNLNKFFRTNKTQLDTSSLVQCCQQKKTAFAVVVHPPFSLFHLLSCFSSLCTCFSSAVTLSGVQSPPYYPPLSLLLWPSWAVCSSTPTLSPSLLF